MILVSFDCYEIQISNGTKTIRIGVIFLEAYGPLFRNFAPDDTYFLTLVPATDVSRQIFRDTCSAILISATMFRDTYFRYRCFATNISRHLFQWQIFRDKYFETLVPATDVSRHLLLFPFNKFDRQARQRCNFLQQKWRGKGKKNYIVV